MRRKASSSSGDVGAPMPGVVVAKVGEGTPCPRAARSCPVGDEDGVHDRRAGGRHGHVGALRHRRRNIEAEHLLATLIPDSPDL